MFVALVDGCPTEASPRAEGRCPLCGAAMTAKCGELVAWHWAHGADAQCDAWGESVSRWHLEWQRRFPLEYRERRIGDHIADVQLDSGRVIEFQRSSITVEDIRIREEHYGPNLRWLFDARDAYQGGRIQITDVHTRYGVFVEFLWVNPRRSLKFSARPVFLDLGEKVLALRRFGQGANCSARPDGKGGWEYPCAGYLMTVDEFIVDCNTRALESTGRRKVLA